MPPRIVIPADPQRQWLHSPQLERLKQTCSVEYYVDEPHGMHELLQRISKADCVISPVNLHWPEDFFRTVQGLKLIVLLAIGTDSVDLLAARKHSVDICNVPGKTADVVAEHTLGLMLGVARRMFAATSSIKKGKWNQTSATMLRGKRLGILGTGATGAATSKLAKAIGMEVVAWTFNPSRLRAEAIGLRYLDFDEVISTSDVLSIHLKSTKDTYNMVGEREIALMKKGAILINVARGAILEKSSVAKALASGHLAGLGADVFDKEPVEPNHPWLNFDNVILTPHVADYTPEGMELLNEGAVDNVLAYLAGEPINIVN